MRGGIEVRRIEDGKHRVENLGHQENPSENDLFRGVVSWLLVVLA
jgi:hypothetical protein